MYSLLKMQAEATWDSGLSVCAKAGLRIWLITPTTDVDVGEVNPRSPMVFEKGRDGSATREEFFRQYRKMRI